MNGPALDPAAPDASRPEADAAPQLDVSGVVDAIAGGVGRALRIAGASTTLVVHVLEHVETLVTTVLRDSGDVAREAEALYQVVSENAVQFREAFRSAPRFTRIVGEVLRIVAAYRVYEKRALVLTPEAARAELDRIHADSAERLYELCVELRGGVLKFGQFASARLDLLPPAYVEHLSKLQDRVPAIPYDEVAARIEEELGAHPEELFETFEPEPLGSASLAQVHRARTHEGREVVVKVQYPGIEDIVETDLAAFRVLARSLKDLLPIPDPVTIQTEISRSIREELDYESEARHAATFGEHFDGDPHVESPDVLGELSSSRVLTLGLLEGERLVDFLDGCRERGEAGAAELDRFFEIWIGCFCRQVLEHGFFHADPHPGNFLVLPGADGPRLGILDFGSVKAYRPEVRRSFAELAGAVIGGNREAMAVCFRTMGFRTQTGDLEPLEQFAEMFLDVFRTSATIDLADIDPMAELERALRLAKENPLVSIPQEFVLLGRVFTAMGGLVLHYQPRLHLQAILMPYLLQVLQTPKVA